MLFPSLTMGVKQMRSRRNFTESRAYDGSTSTEKFWRRAALVTLLTFAVAVPSSAQVASALIREGDALPAAGAGHVVASLANTATNHAGGFAVSLNSGDGSTTLSHIWGNAAGGAGAILRTEGTFGTFTQNSFESFYGMSDSGALAYSSSGDQGSSTGLDSVWVDDTPVAVEEEPMPTLPGQYWSFASRPSISADGTPHFVGGVTSTPGGSTENRLLSSTMAHTVLLMGGDAVPGLPEVLDTSGTVSFDYRFSALSSHYITEVQMANLSTTVDNAVVVDGAGLMLDGSLVQEGTAIPVSVGGLAGENWDGFDFMGYTEAGEWFFTGDSDGATATDEFILKNGSIFVREGDMLGGETLSGAIEGAYMNEDGDVAFIWDVQAGALEALYLNDQLLLTEGDEVDWTGDGAVDAGYTLTNFTGISALTIGDRDGMNEVRVYFTADVADPTGAELEGFFGLPVSDVPVELLAFSVE